MKLIDFHCDTPAEMFEKRVGLSRNGLHVDLARLHASDCYCQVAALFCPADCGDEEGFLRILQYEAHLREAIRAEEGAVLAADGSAAASAFAKGDRVFLLSVEDLRILNGSLERIPQLRALGVRLATPVWRGESAIGGAFDTEAGLTTFGKEAVAALLFCGIVPDASHASRATFREMASLCRAAGRPLVATHSSSYVLCPHGRNLTDEELRTVAELGGVIGICLNPPFLSPGGAATLDDLVRHIRHIIRVAGRASVALGTDFDGIAALPQGISAISDLPKIAAAMKAAGFYESEIDGLFYRNGLRFLTEL